MKPKKANKKFLEEQVRLMLNEVEGKDPTTIGGKLKKDSAYSQKQRGRMFQKLAGSAKDLFRDFMIGSEREIEDFGKQLAAKYHFAMEENMLPYLRKLPGMSPGEALYRLLTNSREFVMKEVEHFAAVQKRDTEFRLALRFLASDLGDFGTSIAGVSDTETFVDKATSGRKPQLSRGMRANSDTENSIHGLIIEIAALFGVKYSLPPKPRYEMWEWPALSLSKGNIFSNIKKGDQEELDRARKAMIKRTKKTLLDLGLADLYQSAMINSKFFYVEKWPAIDGPKLISMIQFYILSCIPKLEKIYLDSGSESQFPWTGKNKPFNGVVSALVSKVKDKYDTGTGKDFDKLQEYNQELLLRSFRRIERINERSKNALYVPAEIAKNMIQLSVGAEALTKFLGMTGLKNFLLNVTVDVLIDIGIFEIIDVYRSKTKEYKDFSQAVSDLTTLTIEHQNNPSQETLTEIDETIDAIRKLSYQIIEVQEKTVANRIIKIIDESEKPSPGALEVRKKLENFSNSLESSMSLSDIRLSPDGRPIGLGYNIDCIGSCSNKTEIDWYNSDNKEDKERLLSWLEEFSRLAIEHFESNKKPAQRLNNYVKEIKENIESIRGFIDKMSDQRQEDENKSKQIEKSSDDELDMLQEGPLDAIAGAFGVAVDVTKTMGIFWGLDKLKKSLAPKRISDAKTVHDVRSYLIANFNMVKATLPKIDDVYRTYGDAPSGDYISKKQNYWKDNLLNTYYAAWKSLKMTPPDSAWVHRPVYIVDISTRYLANYDNHRITLAFDVIPHPVAVKNNMVAIREDRIEKFYAPSYNVGSLMKLGEAIDTTKNIIQAASQIITNRLQNVDPETDSVDGVSREVVEQFLNFTSKFYRYFDNAHKALSGNGMEAEERAWHMDILGEVMEILRG